MQAAGSPTGSPTGCSSASVATFLQNNVLLERLRMECDDINEFVSVLTEAVLETFFKGQNEKIFEHLGFQLYRFVVKGMDNEPLNRVSRAYYWRTEFQFWLTDQGCEAETRKFLMGKLTCLLDRQLRAPKVHPSKAHVRSLESSQVVDLTQGEGEVQVPLCAIPFRRPASGGDDASRPGSPENGSRGSDESEQKLPLLERHLLADIGGTMDSSKGCTSGTPIEEPNYGSGDLPGIPKGSLSSRVRAICSPATQRDQDGNRYGSANARDSCTSRVQQGRLGLKQSLLLERGDLPSGRIGALARQKVREGGGFSELCGKRRRVEFEGSDGDSVLSDASTEVGDQSERISEPFFATEAEGSLRGLVLRCDGYEEDFVSSGVRQASGSYQTTVYKPPRVEWKNGQTVVHWVDKPKGGSVGRRSSGDTVPSVLSTPSGSNDLLGRDQRSFGLFYISSIVRHDSGQSLGLLSRLPSGRDEASVEADKCGDRVHEDEPIGWYHMVVPTIPGFCCRDPERTGLCAACCIRCNIRDAVAGDDDESASD